MKCLPHGMSHAIIILIEVQSYDPKTRLTNLLMLLDPTHETTKGHGKRLCCPDNLS